MTDPNSIIPIALVPDGILQNVTYQDAQFESLVACAAWTEALKRTLEGGT